MSICSIKKRTNKNTELTFNPPPYPQGSGKKTLPPPPSSPRCPQAASSGSDHPCAPTAPSEAVVAVFTHGRPQETQRLPSGAWSHHPWSPPRPPRSAKLCSADSPLRRGGSRGDLARDTPPLPRNSPTRQGQGRPSSRRRLKRPLDLQAGAGPRRERGGGRNEKAPVQLVPPGDSVSPSPPSKADNTGSCENWRGHRSRGHRTKSRRRPGRKTALPLPNRTQT